MRPLLPAIPPKFQSKYLQLKVVHAPLSSQFLEQRITIPNPSGFYKKYQRIRAQPDQLEFISDFDFTITKFRHANRHCDSLFGMWVANKCTFLPQGFVSDLLANYREFGPYETDSTISFEERVHLVGELYKFQTQAFQKYQITHQMAEKVLDSSYLVYRNHTKQLLECLQKHKIPLYIISGGISDSIDSSLVSLTRKHYRNISIHSNQLQEYRTQSGKYLRFRPTLIHSYNKYKVMNHVDKRKNCFLMGDLVSDIYMAEGNGYENVISVFYAKQAENDQRAQAERKFDLIVEGDSSHRVIVELVNAINGGPVDWHYLQTTKSGLHELLI